MKQTIPAIRILIQSNTLEELKTAWESLKPEARAIDTVIAYKDQLKDKIGRGSKFLIR